MRIVISFLLLFFTIHLSLIANTSNVQKLLTKADAFFENEEFEKAENSYQQYLNRFQKKLSWEEKGYIFNQLLSIQILNKNDKKSQLIIKQLLNNYEAIDKKSLIVAKSNFLIGEYYKSKWDGDKAIDYYNKSIQINSTPILDSLLFGNTKGELGYCFNYIFGDFQKAKKYFEEEAIIYQKIKKVPHKWEINNYYNLTTIFRKSRDYSKALIYGNLTLKKAKIHRKNDVNFLSKCHSIIGNIYFNLNQIEESISFYNKGINLLEKNQIYDSNLSFLLINLGQILLSSENYSEAQEQLQNAVKYIPATDSIRLSYAHSRLGTCHLLQENFNSSYFHLIQSLKYGRPKLGKFHTDLAFCYSNLGDFYQSAGQLDSALAYNQLSLICSISRFSSEIIADNPKVKDLVNSDGGEEFLYKKARLLYELYQQNQKIHHLIAANEVINILDAYNQYSLSFPLEIDQVHNAFHRKLIYSDGLAILYDLFDKTKDFKYQSAFFEYMEKSKSLILLDKISSLNSKAKFLPDSLLLQEIKVNSELFDGFLPNSKFKNPETLQQLMARKEDIIREYQKNYPNYYKTRFQSKIESAKLVQDWLKEQNAQIIQYQLSEKYLFAIVVTPKTISIKKIPLNAIFYENLENLIKILRANSPFINANKKFITYSKTAHFFFKKLIEPFIGELENQQLIIIPDERLSFIPFEALITKVPAKLDEINYQNLPYLIHNFAISYAYSTSVLINRKQYRKLGRPLSILGFSFSNDQTTSSMSLQKKEEELVFSPKELTAIGIIFPKSNTFLFKGKAATKQNFLDNLKDKDLIHLALHNQVNDFKKNKKTGLIFNPTSTTDTSYFLNEDEIYLLKEVPKLVVLNSCESGIGVNKKGEGVYSLARAFSYAGSSSILMSLWKISDQSSFSITESFYQNLAQGHNLSKSLQLAKTSYLKSSDEFLAFPGNWAQLVVIGQFNLSINQNHKRFLVVFVGLLSSLLFITYCFNRSKSTYSSS